MNNKIAYRITCRRHEFVIPGMLFLAGMTTGNIGNLLSLWLLLILIPAVLINYFKDLVSYLQHRTFLTSCLTYLFFNKRPFSLHCIYNFSNGLIFGFLGNILNAKDMNDAAVLCLLVSVVLYIILGLRYNHLYAYK